MFNNEYSYLGIDIAATARTIEELINARSMSDKELSELMNVSVQAVNKWRHGKSFPDIENLYILSQILNVTIDELIIPVTVHDAA